MIKVSFAAQLQAEKNLYYLSTDCFYFSEVVKEVFCDYFCLEKGFVKERFLEGKLADFINKAKMPSLFIEKKFIIIDKFTSSLDEKDKILLKSLVNEPIESCDFALLIIESGAAFAPSTKQFVTINVKKFAPYEMAQEIKDIFDTRRIKIEQALCSNIFELSGQNIDYALNEINKLSAYCALSGEVSAESVDLIVIPNIDKSVFVLINCLSKCNFSQAMTELVSLQKRNTPSALVLAAILSGYRRMMFCLLSKMPAADIAKALGVKETAIKISIDNARGYTQVKLKQIVDFIIKCEFEFKSGVTREEYVLLNIVTFIVNLMNGYAKL